YISQYSDAPFLFYYYYDKSKPKNVLHPYVFTFLKKIKQEIKILSPKLIQHRENLENVIQRHNQLSSSIVGQQTLQNSAPVSSQALSQIQSPNVHPQAISHAQSQSQSQSQSRSQALSQSTNVSKQSQLTNVLKQSQTQSTSQ